MGRASAKGKRNRVRSVRRHAECTQAELADAVGVTRQTVAALEAGDYAPSVYLALAIAEQFATTVERLFADAPDTGDRAHGAVDTRGIGTRDAGRRAAAAREAAAREVGTRDSSGALTIERVQP